MSKIPNVIILTSGLSGSSVLTGLIAQGGFWIGDTTFKKEYDTYENSELINLNLRLLQEARYTGNYTMEFSQETIDFVSSLRNRIDPDPYRNFVEKCEKNSPWVWKDPRLWLTIRFWAQFTPVKNCKYILLTRDVKHTWVSSTLRRQIRSYGSLKRYESSIEKSIRLFLTSEGVSFLSLTHENLITKPERSISELNSYLGTQLSVEDLKRIYRGPLYKIPRSSPGDYVKAALIYLKNYSERADVQEQRNRAVQNIR